ncbi:hypothetical protein NLG97_g7203 [Lecanicillium saksenae]|uniref:Uncharacterized protein n=1 Tax=Lecanicillium saksenae TaxID=468837 RepID=A0ACC1QN13_9HYPO|nr:hypothetical protein NLG97_g7203 [Lecanicillium saksenae]
MSRLQDFLNPIEQRIDRRIDVLEQRINRIENTLNLVLKHLGIVTEETRAPSPAAGLFRPDKKPGSYEYHPLEESRDEIRLLAVYSSDDENEPVNCRLINTSIPGNTAGAIYKGEVTEFKTLSYTWGDPTSTTTAFVDGHEFPVTQNLDAALRNIRKQNPPPDDGEESRPTFWWIDAICINQNDISERSQQVNLMTKIYRKAAGVHIWLGEESDDSDLAMGLVRRLSDASPQGPGIGDVRYRPVSEDHRAANWKALIALFQRPWWARVWVRQEVAVANTAVVHCGNESCEFSALAATADILIKVDETLGPDSFLLSHASRDSLSSLLIASPYVRASVLAGFRTAKAAQPNLAYRDLEDLIIHTKACSATDMRDKVFSMLGLLDPTVWELRAEYSLSFKEALMSAARCIISKKQSLNILAAGQNPQRLHQLASWAPNLIDGWKTRQLPSPMPPRLGIVSAGEEPDFTFDGDGLEILRAKGCKLDVIETICPGTPGQGWSDDQLHKLSAAWKGFIRSAFSGKNGGFMDRGITKQYLEDEMAWIRFLSAGGDSGGPRSTTSTPLSLDSSHRYELVNCLLLKQESSQQPHRESSSSENRTLQALRKYCVGRRICVSEMGDAKGRVHLVPVDAEPGDEVWVFRGTRSAFVLRKIENGCRVVVGEAFCTSHLFVNKASHNPSETISIC